MCKYLYLHHDEFVAPWDALAICLMQLFIAIYVEFLNQLVICSSETPLEIVVDLSALTLISEVDNVFYEALKVKKLAKSIDEGLFFTRTNKVCSDMEHHKSCFYKFVKMFYSCIKVLYNSFYFYYMPLTVFLIIIYYN